MNKKTIFTFMVSALLVTGCGGGGGGSSSGGGTSGLPLSTTPTAKFSTSTDPSALTKEVQGGLPQLVSSVSMQNIPAAVSTLPAGISGNYSCANFGTTGSGYVSYDTNLSSTSTSPTVGTYINMTFNSCTYTVSPITTTLNGSASITYTRYNTSTDFATSNSFSNFTMDVSDSSTSPATTNSFGPISGTYTLDDSNGTITIATSLPNGGVTDVTSSEMYTSGTTASIYTGTYIYNSPAAGGIIKVQFSNWSYDTSSGSPIPVGGTITVTDVNGNTIVMTANGDTTVTVTYNINGTTTSYTVTFP